MRSTLLLATLSLPLLVASQAAAEPEDEQFERRLAAINKRIGRTLPWNTIPEELAAPAEPEEVVEEEEIDIPQAPKLVRVVRRKTPTGADVMARAVHERAHAAHQRHAKKYVWWSSIIQDGQTGPDANSNVNLLSTSTTIPLATPTAQSANSVTSSPTSKTSTTQSVFAGTRSNLNVGAIVPASSSLTAARKSRTPRPSTTSSKKHPALFSARLPPGRHLSSSPKIQKRVYQGAAILQDGDTLPLPTAADTPQASLVAPTFAPLGPDDEITVTKEIDGESFTVVIGAQATSTLVDAVEQALPTDTAASVAPTTANVSSESASSSDAESSVEEPSSTSSAAEAQETAATESVVDSTVPQSYTQAQMQTLASLYASFLQLLGL